MVLSEEENSQASVKRPYISIYWKCCRVFSRIYKNKSATAYCGNCPRCRSPIEVPIGEGGTEQRTFIAG